MKYILIIFLILSSFPLNAQKVYLGIGANSTKTSFNNPEFNNLYFNKTNKLVLDLNFLIEFDHEKLLSVKTGILHHTLGLDYSYVLIFGSARQNITESYLATYLDFPVLLTFNIPNKNRSFWLQLSSGPFFSHGISGSSFTQFGKAESYEGFPDRFNKSNLGLFVSTGLGCKKVQVACYYMKILTEIVTNPSSNGMKNSKSSVFGVNIVWIINISKKNLILKSNPYCVMYKPVSLTTIWPE